MPSYRKKLALPAWGLYAKDGSLIATIRAPTSGRAKDVFHAYETKMPELRAGYVIRRVEL
jgi:hypothetical protein